MIEILYLIVWETFDKSCCVCFIWFIFVWIFTRTMFSISPNGYTTTIPEK